MDPHLLLSQLVAIGVLQGFTEFLPISSSGHLILLPHLAGWADQGIVYDIAAHFGTLIAVVAYFQADIRRMLHHWLGNLSGAPGNEYSRLAWAVLWGTVPVSVIGLVTHDFIAQYLRHPLVIAGTTIGFGIVLWLADALGRRIRDTATLNWSDIVLIGLAQCLALVPGTSRSGITMSAGLALGLTRCAAARFSFLLSIPVIFLATAYETWQLLQSPMAVDWVGLVAVVASAGISAFVCIALFLSLLDKIGMLPFVLYRFVLGAFLIVLYI